MAEASGGLLVVPFWGHGHRPDLDSTPPLEKNPGLSMMVCWGHRIQVC